MPPFPFLQPGDQVALVATARPSPREDVEGVIRSLEEHYGVSAIALSDTYTKCPPSERAAILLRHLLNDEIKLIWVMRGGEGSADLIPFLEAKRDQLERAAPKLVMGLSDFTPILLYVAQRLGWPAVHGMAADSLVRHRWDKHTHQVTQQFLTGSACNPLLDELVPLNAVAKHEGEVVAEACTANLSLANISIKDCWEIETRDKIVILEDWQEKGFVVERTLKYFNRIGLFDEARALVLGDFLARPIGADADEQTLQANYMQHIQRRFASQCDFPVLQTDAIGHGRRCVPMPFHYPLRLRTGTHPILMLTETAADGQTDSD